MCGIVAYIGKQQALPLLVNGLKRVEYRGYDSAGVAVLDDSGILGSVKKKGKIAALEEALRNNGTLPGTLGIAHTRWATHGIPSDANAHPHFSCNDDVAVVHNGTIENYQEMRELARQQGHTFRSETDTEVLAHLLEEFLAQGDDLVTAVQRMHAVVQGAYGIAVLASKEPDRLVVARHGSPLVLGLTDDGYFAASDATAFREHTDKVIYLNDGEMATFDRDGYRVLTLKNEEITKCVEKLEWDLAQIAKDGYEHFMLKEIMEQPAVLRQTLAGRLTDGEDPRVHLGGGSALEPLLARGIDRVLMTACGTSWHAGLIGKRMMEKLLGIPVTVEYASEFATGHTPVDARTLTIVISQSGETKDTIEAAHRARSAGSFVWNICNVVGSSLTRVADSGMYTHAGPEIGVASTKAFTAQVVSLALLSLKLAELRPSDRITPDGMRTIARALESLPQKVEEVLAENGIIQSLAKEYWEANNFLYLGRGYNFPTALEGALKLKEISYIHAEGYPAGEMKHGPIALIDEHMPVVVIAPQEGENEATYHKIMANIEEVAARGGKVIVIASKGDPVPQRLLERTIVSHILTIPATIAMLTPVLASIHCQLLAYSIAALRGCAIDQPRNLAKSVTVE